MLVTDLSEISLLTVATGTSDTDGYGSHNKQISLSRDQLQYDENYIMKIAKDYIGAQTTRRVLYINI